MVTKGITVNFLLEKIKKVLQNRKQWRGIIIVIILFTIRILSSGRGIQSNSGA